MESDLNEKIKTLAAKEEIKTLVRKAELKDKKKIIMNKKKKKERKTSIRLKSFHWLKLLWKKWITKLLNI